MLPLKACAACKRLETQSVQNRPRRFLCRRTATLEKPHLSHGSQPLAVEFLRHEVLRQEVKLDPARADHELVSRKVDAALVALEVVQAKDALGAALLLEHCH